MRPHPDRFFVSCLIVLCVSACHRFDQDKPPYNFRKPDHQFTLPKSLDEISGLTPLDWQYAAGVDDEAGKFFIIDVTTGKVISSKKFADNSDFEDIVRSGARLYILDGNGTIYDIEDMRAPKLNIVRYSIAGIENPEGIEFDDANDRLLIGALYEPGNGASARGAVYAFDLKTKQLNPEPIHLIEMSEIISSLGKDTTKTNGIDRPIFKPSALALQPSTGDLYVISSKVHALVVFSSSGRMKAAYPLPTQIYPEPEGISFLPNGSLYISNEEHKGKPPSLVGLRHRFSLF